MIDAMTRRPLYVSTDGTAGPYIMVPVSQLAELREVLDKNQIRYSVEEEAVSLNGAPEIAVVDLGRGASVAAIEAILKGVE
jgi:hypothetical protein